MLLLDDDTVKHIEFQASNDRDMSYREGIYAFVIGQTYRRPVSQDVLYFGSEEMQMEDHVDVGAAKGSYRLIDIREFDAEALLATRCPGDWALAMLARGGVERLRDIFERAKSLPPSERGRLFTQLAFLSGLRGLSNRLRMEIKAMESGYIEIEDNPILQDWMEEAGRRANARVLRMQLEGKFGALPQWVLERLKHATQIDLDSWFAKVVTASSLEGILGRE